MTRKSRDGRLAISSQANETVCRTITNSSVKRVRKMQWIIEFNAEQGEVKEFSD